MSAAEILRKHGVTRLCHFTKLKNLIHILTENDGILATDRIEFDIKSINDMARYDGQMESVCCSVEYPNSWYMNKTEESCAISDPLFNEWAVIFIDIEILSVRNFKFCPCNASKKHGSYINSDMNALENIFDEEVLGGYARRPAAMLQCCPTDGQAEILIDGNVPKSYISGVAVCDDHVAKRLYAILKMYNMTNLKVFVAPALFTAEWSNLARIGQRADERLYVEER